MKTWYMAGCGGGRSGLRCLRGQLDIDPQDVTTQVTGTCPCLSFPMRFTGWLHVAQMIYWTLACGLFLLPHPHPSHCLLYYLITSHSTWHSHTHVHTQPEIERLFLIHCYLAHMHNSCLILVVIFRKYCLSLSVK